MGYHVRVKICGITQPDDLDAAVAAGADAIGLNFHPPSPRYVSLDQAVLLLARLPPFVEPVGVFVRQTLAALRPTLDILGRVRVVQIHGGPAEVMAAHPYVHIPAFAVRDRADLDAIRAYLDACRLAGALPGAILVDGFAPGLAGGTGKTAPWDLLADFASEVPLILAGGLTPENVAEAIRQVRPWGVDVAGGVESSPGRKDRDRVRRFIDRARESAR